MYQGPARWLLLSCALVKNNAAIFVKDSDAKAQLLQQLQRLLHDNALQSTMSANLRAMAIKDADERIANKVIEIANMDQ